MGSHRRSSKHGHQPMNETTRGRKRLPIVAAIVGVGLVTTALLVFYFGGDSGGAGKADALTRADGSTSATNPAPTAAPTETASSSPAATASEKTVTAVPKPDFSMLKGRWLRPDGGYVLEIRDVHDDGGLNASYRNPRSIHVAKAQAARNGGATRVFVELRDANYPGSTYTLVYSPQTDRLQGVYYQAVQGQSFEVFFVRMK